MDEGDPPASGTGAWRVVDEAIAGGPAGGERRVEVGHSVAHMMDSRPPTSEKSRDGAVRIPGRRSYGREVIRQRTEEIVGTPAATMTREEIDP